MAIGLRMKTGSLAVLAAALAATALPAAAQAQEDGGRRWQAGARPDGGEARPDRSERRAGWRGRGDGENQGQVRARAHAPAHAQVQTAPAPPPTEVRRSVPDQPRWQGRNAERGWSSRGGEPATTENRAGWRTRGDMRRDGQWSGSTRQRGEVQTTTPVAPPYATARMGDGTRDGYRRDGRDRTRTESWRQRDGYRDGSGMRDAYRSGYRDGHREWNRDWRRDRRYDWYSYRNAYRSHYRMGTYYAPYRHYSYRRLSIGFFLDSMFFGNRYWLDDPWSYRLPEVYGPYRWVRYYDDVLLVDIYSGRVVDVIYDFFW